MSIRRSATSNNKKPCNITYNAYGHTHSAESNEAKLLYDGELLLGCLYFLGAGYRSYNPALMRFHSSDEHSPFGVGELNTYAYCLGDPVNWVDPSGQARIKRIAHKPNVQPTPSTPKDPSKHSTSKNVAHSNSRQEAPLTRSKNSDQERYRSNIGITHKKFDPYKTSRGMPRITKREKFHLHYYNKNYVGQNDAPYIPAYATEFDGAYSKRQYIMFTIIYAWRKGIIPMAAVRNLGLGLTNGDIIRHVSDLGKELSEIRKGKYRYTGALPSQ